MKLEEKQMGDSNEQNFSLSATSIIIGSHYEHYKTPGFYYKILAIARHTETNEELVVYQALDKNGSVWVRPISMFLGSVVVNGQTQPRFKIRFATKKA